MNTQNEMPQLPKTKGERTRTVILDCASRLFYVHGYEATSFSQIVEASGLVRGNIYHYFKSKDDILMAVVDRRLDSYRTMLARWEVEHETPKDRILAFIAMLAEQQNELALYGCPIGSLNMELGKGRRDLQLAARTLFDLFRDWLAARLGEMGLGRGAQAQALHLLGRAQGVAMLAHVYEDSNLLKHELKTLQAWVKQLP